MDRKDTQSLRDRQRGVCIYLDTRRKPGGQEVDREAQALAAEDSPPWNRPTPRGASRRDTGSSSSPCLFTWKMELIMHATCTSEMQPLKTGAFLVLVLTSWFGPSCNTSGPAHAFAARR